MSNYTLAGFTNPTSSGAVGVLNSATLSANFTAKTVDTSVNATVSGNTWNATATGMPIQQGVYFQAIRENSAGNLNLNCTGGCTGALSGRIVGGFSGTTGQGAGIAYSFNAGGSTGQTIAGVAAFKR